MVLGYFCRSHGATENGPTARWTRRNATWSCSRRTTSGNPFWITVNFEQSGDFSSGFLFNLVVMAFLIQIHLFPSRLKKRVFFFFQLGLLISVNSCSRFCFLYGFYIWLGFWVLRDEIQYYVLFSVFGFGFYLLWETLARRRSFLAVNWVLFVAVQFFPFQKNLRILIACFHFPSPKQQCICGSGCVKYILYEFRNNFMGFVLYLLWETPSKQSISFCW